MDSGLYAACTALMARTDALDTIANNLANASTNGFRGRQTSFSSVLAGSGHPTDTQLNDVTNSYGLLSNSRLNLQAGSFERTNNDLDVAVEGPGFLTVQTAHGTMYTRNGSLQVSPAGQLQTATGDAVLGERGPITLPSGSKVTISPDGTVSADSTIAGKLKLVEFKPTADPQSAGGSYYTAAATDVVASPGSTLRQGMLESSNVNPVTGVIDLISAQRALEGMRHALTMIDSEMDKTATVDLPRVSA